MFHRKRTAVVAAALCWFSASKALAVAVDRTWGNTSGGSFQTPGNWIGGVVPDSDDTAIFDASSSSTPYTVTFTGSVVNDKLEADDNVTLNLTGVSYILNNTGTQAMLIGTSGETFRTLTISGGTLSSSGDIRVATTAGVGSGLAVPSGGTLLFAGSTINVADASDTTGSLNISGGFASGGSVFLGVGGEGSVIVNNSATLALTNSLTVSTGSVQI